MSRWLARRPEYVVLAVAAGAWVWMLAHAATSPRLTCCRPEPSWLEDFAGWTAMVVAMMLPTTLAQMRDVAARSYRLRRLRSVVAYALGYTAWWLVLGVAICSLRGVLPADAAFALFGAAWTLVPWRMQWHRRCHRRLPLHPVEWRATASAFRQGAAHGAPCIALCWPLMIACMLTGHSLFVMIACTAHVIYEKRMVRRLERVPLVVAALAIAVLTLIV